MPNEWMPMTTNSEAPGLDAEDAGIGERVAGDSLHQRAGEPEPDADEHRR